MPEQLNKKQSSRPAWFSQLKKYGHSDARNAIWQLFDSLIPYLMIWGLMIYLVKAGYSYWLTLGCTVIAAMFLIRIFIIFHDCCHSSFFRSNRINKLVGYLTGVLTFTPFEVWRKSHLKHHMSAGDLDRRGVGDVWTMTLDEYRNASWQKRLGYRLYRNPLLMFGLGPVYIFLLGNRFPERKANRTERISVHITNAALLAIFLIALLTIGWKTYLLIQLPVILIAAAMGIWLFYVQHQFENAYWARHEQWDPIKAALQGSSYYKLPKILQWFTGNIGLHHIHHIRPAIPNYHLQKCYDEMPVFQRVTPLTLRSSLRSIRLKLWDEQRQKMVGFRAAKNT